MAKSRSHRGSRDDNYIANPVDPLQDLLRPSLLSRPILDPIHDLRVYNPTVELLGPLEVQGAARVGRVRSAVTKIGPSFTAPARSDRMGNPVFSQSNTPLVRVFKTPGKVPVCVRRQQRREVIFARGRAGRGYRKPRWSPRSYERCR